MPAFNFVCSNPDFTIRTVPHGTIFRVNKRKMAAGSGVFRDMFGVCDTEDLGGGQGSLASVAGSSDEMEVHESPEIFELFLALLHEDGPAVPNKDKDSSDSDSDDSPSGAWQVTSPNGNCVNGPPTNGQLIKSSGDRLTSVPSLIPLPILTPLFYLIDKYDSPVCHAALANHLKSHAQQSPLEVYSLAHQLDLTSIAAHASQYLHSPPLETYTVNDVIRLFPSLLAYHRLVLLHAHRKEKLREIVLNEEVFPHDYGLCHRLKHGEETRKLWETHQRSLALRVTAGMDLPAEMAIIVGSLNGCPTCKLAAERAIAMMQYKVDKVAWKFDRVPGTSTRSDHHH